MGNSIWVLRIKLFFRNEYMKILYINGNSLTFGYLRNINDLNTYQGSEYQFIGIDELTQLERFKYIYMRSRVRKTKDNKLSTQLMCSSNPGKRGNKWVRERFIEKID